MPLIFRAPKPLEYFSNLVASDDQFPLLEAAASLAMDEYPELDVQRVPGEMDLLLARLKRRVAHSVEPAQRLQTLNRYFFRDLGFGGNLNHYHDPENSYLHAVLQTRRGIPVSLAVLWLELAGGIGLSVHGVGFPGHFLVRADLPDGSILLDPFTGVSLSRDDLWERLDSIRPGGDARQATGALLDGYLRPVAPRSVIARMLFNLKEIHRSLEDWPRMLAVLDRLLVLMPEAWSEFRDRGLVHAELGALAQAVQDLETYLTRAPAQPDRATIEDRLADLRGHLRG